MDLHQLTTFVTVARLGSITRASETLHLSQPAVSAHVKALEDELALVLFERTARGMALTNDGRRLLEKAERTLEAQRNLVAEAARLQGRLAGKLRLGAARSVDPAIVGRVLAALAERLPEVDVALRHAGSSEVRAALAAGELDGGFFNTADAPPREFVALDVASFRVFVAARPGRIDGPRPVEWSRLADAPWIVPESSGCCGRAAELLFEEHALRPRRIHVDAENVIRALVVGGIGVGLLHEPAAREAEARGEVELLHAVQRPVRIVFAVQAARAGDPLVAALLSIARGSLPA